MTREEAKEYAKKWLIKLKLWRIHERKYMRGSENGN